mgnify:CR=1 FL=1
MKKDELHARVLYLYQILRHYSDSEHPLTTQQILKIMDEEYHIQIHRVSVQNYVEILNSCGIKVNQQRAQDKYYYLDDRTFDIPELKLIIDAVQASRFIPEEKTNELIDKLLTLTSDYNADRLRDSSCPSQATTKPPRIATPWGFLFLLSAFVDFPLLLRCRNGSHAPNCRGR